MRIFLSIVALFVSIPFGYAQGVQFENNFETALSKAKEADKPLFIAILGRRNEPSERMQNSVFTNAQVGELYNSRFVSLLLWDDAPEARTLFSNYGISYAPAYLFLSPEEDFLKKENNFKAVEAILELGQNYKHPQADALAAGRRAYRDGTIGQEELKGYIELCSSLGLSSVEALEAWIVRGGKEAVGAEAYKLIKEQPCGVESAPFKFVVDNADSFAALVGDKEVEIYIYGKYFTSLRRTPALLEALRNGGYKYAEALKEHVALEALLSNSARRDEFITQARAVTERYPVVAPLLGTSVMRQVNKKEPELESYIVELAEKAAIYSKPHALQIARYIVTQYLIMYADIMGVDPWVDRCIEWSGDPDYEKSTTRLVKLATGEYPCDNYGKEMADFTLKDLEDRPVSLSDFRGSFVLFDFWASWCGPCKAELPHVKKAYEQFSYAPIKFVSITTDQDDEAWKKAAVDDFAAPWLHLSAKGTEMTRTYGVRAIPRLMVLDPDGKLVADHITGNTITTQLRRLSDKYGWKKPAPSGFAYKIDVTVASDPVRAYLYYFVDGEPIVDSVDVVDNHFVFSGVAGSPCQASLILSYDPNAFFSPRDLKDVKGINIEEGTLVVTSAGLIKNATVTGSVLQSDTEKWNALTRSANSAGGGNREEGRDRTAQRVAQSQTRALAKEFIKNDPDSWYALYRIYDNVVSNQPVDTMQAVLDCFSERLRASDLGKEKQAAIDVIRATAIGAVAPDFTQNDPDGNPVTLSDFRGKWVLIDFWASWCAPCRADNPNVVEAYNLYKDKGFTILGVSLDSDNSREAWVKAIEDDKLAWTHVSDLKFWKNAVVKMYGVRSVPSNFLINPEGVIVAKNLHGKGFVEELRKHLP